jgi:putative RNA 2'-phosphotransferase
MINLNSLSKFLSLLLRHRPDIVGLVLDEQGWADIDELLTRAAAHGHLFERDTLEEVVCTSDKRRFAISDDGRRIRANQGHSVQVDLGLEPVSPPALLYHGTARRFLDSILAVGLESRARLHVHLSAEVSTALTVGRRHGKPVVLEVDAAVMAGAGERFYLSENGVWLTARVAPRHLTVLDG